ncbi:hypothetical protein CCP3SC15_1560005 [Gammaproteobacteria bacterium]
MSNEFYTKSGSPAGGSVGSSSVIRNEFSTLEQAFNKLPAMAGHALEIIRVSASGLSLEPVAGATLGASLVYHGLGGNVFCTAYGNGAMSSSDAVLEKCTAVGYESLKVSTGALGSDNTAIGYQSQVSGAGAAGYNTAVGSWSLRFNTSGDANVAVGYGAGQQISTGANNVAIGGLAMGNNSGTMTGAANIAIGYNCMGMAVFTGSGNIGIGLNTLNNLQTGGNNIAIGNQVGSVTLNSGSSNILIGTSSAVDTPAVGTSNWISLNNKLVINAATAGSEAIGINRSTTSTPGTTALIVGTAATNGNGATLTAAGVWTNASDRRIKQNIRDIEYGLNALMQLRAVSYEMVLTDVPQVGFIAQEVESIIPEVVHVPADESEHYGVSYGNLVAIAVKAIQEQNALIQALTARVHALENSA